MRQLIVVVSTRSSCSSVQNLLIGVFVGSKGVLDGSKGGLDMSRDQLLISRASLAAYFIQLCTADLSPSCCCCCGLAEFVPEGLILFQVLHSVRGQLFVRRDPIGYRVDAANLIKIH